MFFQAFDVYESFPGDYLVEIHEKWKLERWTPESKKWVDVTPDDKKIRHTAIQRHAPPRYPSVTSTTIARKNPPDGCYEHKIIVVDIPHVESFLEAVPGTWDQEINKTTIKQDLTLRYAGSPNPEVKKWTINFALGFKVPAH